MEGIVSHVPGPTVKSNMSMKREKRREEKRETITFFAPYSGLIDLDF